MIQHIKNKITRRILLVLAFALALPFIAVSTVAEVMYRGVSHSMDADPKLSIQSCLADTKIELVEHVRALKAGW